MMDWITALETDIDNFFSAVGQLGQDVVDTYNLVVDLMMLNRFYMVMSSILLFVMFVMLIASLKNQQGMRDKLDKIQSDLLILKGEGEGIKNECVSSERNQRD